MGVNKPLVTVGAVAIEQNGRYVGVEVSDVDNDLVLVFAKEWEHLNKYGMAEIRTPQGRIIIDSRAPRSKTI